MFLYQYINLLNQHGMEICKHSYTVVLNPIQKYANSSIKKVYLFTKHIFFSNFTKHNSLLDNSKMHHYQGMINQDSKKTIGQ